MLRLKPNQTNKNEKTRTVNFGFNVETRVISAVVFAGLKSLLKLNLD